MNPESSIAASTAHLPRRRRRAGWIVFGLLMGLLVTHAWWLKGIGAFLVAEEPPFAADVVLVLGGDHRLQKVVELMAEATVSEVWLVERHPSYAVQAGILPADHIIVAEQLVAMGVPSTRIRTLDGSAVEYEDAAIVLAEELSVWPETRVLILCNRLDGRNLRLVFSSLLSESQFARLSFVGLADDEYDETNWWRSRTGWKETFTSVSDLAFTLVVGVEQDEAGETWDPDSYERELSAQFGEAPCHAE